MVLLMTVLIQVHAPMTTVLPPPSLPFQLYMMRTMLESLISEKTGAAKKPLKLDLKESSIPDFESFHRASFFYGKMLDLSCECFASAHHATSLSVLPHLSSPHPTPPHPSIPPHPTHLTTLHMKCHRVPQLLQQSCVPYSYLFSRTSVEFFTAKCLQILNFVDSTS